MHLWAPRCGHWGRHLRSAPQPPWPAHRSLQPASTPSIAASTMPAQRSPNPRLVHHLLLQSSTHPSTSTYSCHPRRPKTRRNRARVAQDVKPFRCRAKAQDGRQAGRRPGDRAARRTSSRNRQVGTRTSFHRSDPWSRSFLWVRVRPGGQVAGPPGGQAAS